jgi:hypothetical protein
MRVQTSVYGSTNILPGGWRDQEIKEENTQGEAGPEGLACGLDSRLARAK